MVFTKRILFLQNEHKQWNLNGSKFSTLKLQKPRVWTLAVWSFLSFYLLVFTFKCPFEMYKNHLINLPEHQGRTLILEYISMSFLIDLKRF